MFSFNVVADMMEETRRKGASSEHLRNKIWTHFHILALDDSRVWFGLKKPVFRGV